MEISESPVNSDFLMYIEIINVPTLVSNMDSVNKVQP